MPDLPKSLKFLSNKKVYSSLIVVLGLIAIVLFFRSCGRGGEVHKTSFVIGRDSTLHTLQAFGKERNIVAFTNELMATISQKTRFHFQWLESSPSDLLDNLIYENCDAIIEVMTPTAFSKQTMIFSDILLQTGPVVAMSVNENFHSFKDLDGKTIGLNWNTLYNYNIPIQAFINDHHLTVINYSTPLQAFEAMVKGQIDGVIMEAIRVYVLENGLYKDKVKTVTEPFTSEGLRLIALNNKPNEMFIETFNKALEELKKNGEYEAMINKWGLVNLSELQPEGNVQL